MAAYLMIIFTAIAAAGFYTVSNSNLCARGLCVVESVDAGRYVVVDGKNMTHTCYDLGDRYPGLSVNSTVGCYESDSGDCPLDDCFGVGKAAGLSATFAVLAVCLFVYLLVSVAYRLREAYYATTSAPSLE